MKTILHFTLIILIGLSAISCNDLNRKNKQLNKLKTVTVTGKILDFKESDKNQTIKLYIHNTGGTTVTYFGKIMNKGAYKIKFKTYNSTDVVLEYKRGFKVFVRPGDSINVNFSGKSNDFQLVLRSLKFSGNRSLTNSILAQYQIEFSDLSQQINSIKSFNVREYKNKCDSIYKIMKIHEKKFKKVYLPNKETQEWIHWDIEMDKAISLLKFSRNYRTFKKLPSKTLIVDESYDFFNIALSMNQVSLENSKATRWFINIYLYEYIFPKVIADINSKSFLSKLILMWKGIDQSFLEGIEKYTQKNNILKQLCYSAYFNEQINKNSLKLYEDNESFINRNIKEPYLINNLNSNYNKIKALKKTPLILSDYITKNLKDTDLNSFLKDVTKNNKGKILYIDVWATWCSPCIQEMKKSKKIQDELVKKDVQFIYVCIDSKIDDANTVLTKLNIKGKFYFFDAQQSNLLREKFNITGIPYHILVDKKGTIIDFGNHNLLLTNDVLKE